MYRLSNSVPKQWVIALLRFHTRWLVVSICVALFVLHRACMPYVVHVQCHVVNIPLSLLLDIQAGHPGRSDLLKLLYTVIAFVPTKLIWSIRTIIVGGVNVR